MTAFVDANIFLRFLTNDDPVKGSACLALFQQARQRTIELATSESVVAEVVYVLSSPRLYNLDRAEIRDRLYPLLSLPGLKLPDQTLFLRALEIYVSQPVDFEDALTVAHMQSQGLQEIYSYDRDFDRFPELKRREP